MRLQLLRNRFAPEYTGGQLYIDGNYFCFSLEDKVREQEGVAVEKWKIYGETAIPRGIYDVVFEDSPRFGPNTLCLKKVPGFTNIRIHSGNTHKDTEGCIIVGYRINSRGIIVPGTTRPALADLKGILSRAKEPISIQVV